MRAEIIVWIGIVVFFVTFFLLRKFGGPKENEYEKEMNRILTSDEHRVKGRFG